MLHEYLIAAHKPTDRQEATSPEDPRRRNIEQLRMLAENDPILFATRTIKAFESFLQEKIPQAEQSEINNREEGISHLIALGELTANEGIAQVLKSSGKIHESAGYVNGLTEAFSSLTTSIIGVNNPEKSPAQGEPKVQPQTGDITPKK